MNNFQEMYYKMYFIYIKTLHNLELNITLIRNKAIFMHSESQSKIQEVLDHFRCMILKKGRSNMQL